MNNGNAVRKIDNADDGWSGVYKVKGGVTERDAALDRGDQVEVVAGAQKRVTISGVGETATTALATEPHDEISPVASHRVGNGADRNLYRASDGTTYSSLAQVIDYERGLRS